MPMPWEMDYGGGQPSAQTQSPPAAAALPWQKDYGAPASEDQGTFLHPKRPTSTGWQYTLDRLKQYPGLIAGAVADTVENAATLPRDVYEGKVDPFSQEGFGRAMDMAATIAPGAEVAGVGRQLARRAGVGKMPPGAPNPEFRPPTPNIAAAQTAVDLGAPLPAGIVSPTPGTQAITQAARQFPFVGQKIDERVADTIRAAGGRVEDIATELASGAIPDRAVTGAQTRVSLEDSIARNNASIDSVYGDLRSNFIDATAPGALPRTRNTLDAILNERKAAGMAKPQAGLDDVAELLKQGRSFDGLVRARSEVGKIIGLAKNNPNPGFNVGDFKRLYGAMSSDMENLVRANAKTGVTPDMAADALRRANAEAEEKIKLNSNIQRLLNVKADERLVGSIINAAKNKTGNARVLIELRNQMPKQDFEDIVGLGLSELGHNPATNRFSLTKFGRAWNDLSDTAKSTLIADAGHRKALDDIANLGSFLRDADKYINTSGTGRAVMLGSLVTGAGTAVATGDPLKILGVLGAAGGGTLLSKVLARPATASSLRKWALAAKGWRGAQATGGARSGILNIATRNLLSNLAGLAGPEIRHALGFDDQRRPLEVTVGPRRTDQPTATSGPLQ